MSQPPLRSSGVSRERLALELRRARKPFVVLVALGALATGALAVITNQIGVKLPWHDPYTVSVAIDDAKGVVGGKQEVRIAGVPAGRIDKVELDGERPVLTISLDRRYAPLYRDARLRVRPKTPLNDMYLNVEERGSRAAGEVAEGDTLQAERTRTPVDIGRVMNAFDVETRVRLEQAIDEAGRGLADNGNNLRAALVELSPFLQAAQRLNREAAIRRTRTRRLIHNFRKMTEELGRRDDQLALLVEAGAGSFTELASADVALANVMAELPPTMRRLQTSFRALRTAADELDPAFDALQPTARALPAGLRALQDFSTHATPAFRALEAALPEATSLMNALRPTAADLESAFTELRPAAPRLDRVTAAVVPCEFAIQKFFHNTLSVLKFYDSQGALPRGQSVIGGSTAGGLVNEPTHSAGESCAEGGPTK